MASFSCGRLLRVLPRPLRGCCGIARLPRWQRALLFVLSSLLFLHFVIFPASMGYYDEKCYLSQQEKKDMLYLLKSITQIFDRFNQTYWIDFGTLLGAVRNGDIIPYDGDVDVCRMLSGETTRMSEDEFRLILLSFFKKRNITGNTMVAQYGNAKADLFRYRFIRTQEGKTLLKQYYPPFVADKLDEKMKAKFLATQMAKELFLPTKDMTFQGIPLKIPNQEVEVLKLRYSYTWWFSMPYKWRCFLPSTRTS